MRASYEKIVHPPNRSFACYRREDTSFEFECHFHPEFELTLIERGHGMRYVGDSIEPYEAGDLMLIGSNVPHTWSSIDSDDQAGASAVVLQFDRDYLLGRLEDLSELAHVGAMLDNAAMGVKCNDAIFDDVRSLLTQMPGMDPAGQLLQLLSVLHLMASRESELKYVTTHAFSVSLNDKARSQVDKICRHIEAHFDQPLVQSELAGMIDMKSSAFSGFFKRATGRTPSEHLNIVRINAACRLLCETDQSVLEICYACGFRNVANFNRRFKQIMQMTPSAYRTSTL